MADEWRGQYLTAAGVIRRRSSDNRKGGRQLIKLDCEVGHGILMPNFSVPKACFHRGHDSLKHVLDSRPEIL